ncbi:timeless-domain-containing protein [Phaffia rhodozyma]|uniref:Timeless-domain-containing protein n=1 Tax=Phaffia rhodozyma TaxID=264483 RepID=A0A0F7SQ00_PHARH|nr:timeless-domain-containing protein [Phaffia rhodozyma]
MELDLEDMTMGGYGHKEELERIQLLEARRKNKLKNTQDDEYPEHDHEGGENEEEEDREAVLTPVIQTLLAALGGWEDVDSPTGEITKVYRPGDSILGCLKDLKRIWRHDDEDVERTVARIFAKTGLIRELVTIVEEVSERGDFGRKVGLMAAELIASLTWPIDMAAELKELEDEPDTNTDYSSILKAQIEYKAAILRSGVFMERIMSLVLPYLAKSIDERTERDERIIKLVLSLIRNLLSIKDSVSSTHATADSYEKSTLQSRLIVQLDDSHFLQLFITLASSAATKEFNSFNMLVLDVLHLMFRGVDVSTLVKDQTVAIRDSLSSLLEQESLQSAAASRQSTSRHSRFGSTIAIQSAGLKGQQVVVHKSGAINGNAIALLDKNKKKRRSGRTREQDEAGLRSCLTPEAMTVLQQFSREFLEVAFNIFFASVLKDIRMERQKVTEADNLRTLFLSTFFLDFFLSSRTLDIQAHRKSVGVQPDEDKKPVKTAWDFGYVADFCEIDAVRWVVARMRLVLEDTPPGWVELRAGLNCFTQILLLVDAMSTSREEEPVEAAEILQNQIYYNGDILELSIKLMAGYRLQSRDYLDSVIHFACVLLRMLEKYSKGNAYMFFRKKKAQRAKRKRAAAGKEGEEGEENDDEEEALHPASKFAEHAFQFTEFEMKLANEDVLHTLLTYLQGYSEFKSPEKMKRVVSLLHRLAVKVQAEGIFFKVSVLDLFQQILDNELSLPKDPSSKDLLALIHFILRKFFKRLAEHPFLMVEAFFPKNRTGWKKFSSRPTGDDSTDDDDKPKLKKIKRKADVQIRDKTLTQSQQLGIAVSVLLEEGKISFITWFISVLRDAAAARHEIVMNTDGPTIYGEDMTDDDIRAQAARKEISKEALAKFTPHPLDPDTDDKKTAVSTDPHVRLILTLLDFQHDDEAEDPRWEIPARQHPTELDRQADMVTQFIREPLDFDAEPAVNQLKKKAKRAPRKQRAPVEDEDDLELPRAERKRKEKVAEERIQYKSTQFIEVSYLRDEAFYAAEEALRARKGTAALPEAPIEEPSDFALLSSRVKKRKPSREDGRSSSVNKGKKKPKRATSSSADSGDEDDEDMDDEDQGEDSDASVAKPRRKPKARTKKSSARSKTDEETATAEASPTFRSESEAEKDYQNDSDEEDEGPASSRKVTSKKKVVMDSEEED